MVAFTRRQRDIYVLYQTREKVPARVKVFLDFLREWFRTPPPWAIPRRQEAGPAPTRTREAAA